MLTTMIFLLWILGFGLYAISLGGYGYKYGKEAWDMIENEGALIPINDSNSSNKE